MSLIRLIFTGLMTFVPNADDTQMCVLLVDARNPLQVGNETVEPHFGAIVVPLGALADDGRDPDLVLQAEGCDAGYAGEGAAICERLARAVFFLDDEHLTLTPERPTTGALTIDRWGREPNRTQPCCTDVVYGTCSGAPTCPGQVPPFNAQRRDFDWVISFPEIFPEAHYPNAARIKGDCFELGDVPSGAVLARLQLPPGRLSTYLLQGEDRPGNVSASIIKEANFPADLANNLPEITRALTRQVALELEVSGAPELKIETKNLFTGVAGAPLELAGAEDSVLEVVFHNSPRDAIRYDAYDPHAGNASTHFRHYYRLLQDPPDASLWRLPAIVGHAGDLLCPPVEGKP